MNKVKDLLNKNQQQNMSYDQTMDTENTPLVSMEDYSKLISEDPTILQTAKPPKDYMQKALEESNDMSISNAPQTPTAPMVDKTKDILLPPAQETDVQKLERKLQELRDLDLARQETASKYNFGTKAAAIIGDALSRYQTGAIQKNVGVPVQFTGPSLQQMMSMIGEVKAPSSTEQRQALIDRYKEIKADQKAQNASKEAKAAAELKYKRDLAMLDRKLAAEKEIAGMKAAEGATSKSEKPTVGEQTVDREFAKKYNEWRTGGEADYKQNKIIFDEAIKALEDKKVQTGTLAGIGANIPGIRTEARQLETRVRKALNSMLRATLGAQFTENEGERIFEQTFDPSASSTENIKNMKTELKKIEKRARDIKIQGDYFTKNKTLSKFPTEKLEIEEKIQNVLEANPGSNRKQVIEALIKDQKLSPDYE